ncbi:MAG: hypothetical protein Q3995_02345 [Eubacteriales bacterium]|nr:hypothetical protein [Eubacteriales bacterium]
MKIVEKAAKQILILCSLLIVLFVGFILSLVIHERMISHELLNAPFAQCGTAWESEDGIITMVVSDAPAEEPLNYCDPVDGLTVYETETKVLYQEKRHPALISVDYQQQRFFFTVYAKEILPGDVLFTADGHYKMKDESFTLTDIRCDNDDVFSSDPFVIFKM